MNIIQICKSIDNFFKNYAKQNGIDKQSIDYYTFVYYNERKEIIYSSLNDRSDIEISQRQDCLNKLKTNNIYKSPNLSAIKFTDQNKKNKDFVIVGISCSMFTANELVEILIDSLKEFIYETDMLVLKNEADIS